MHCAAGLRLPVSEIAERYAQEYGVTVRTQFAGSGELASQLEVAGGDLFLPADVSYIAMTKEKGLVQESIPAAYLTAGMVVAKGNPKNIRTLADLAREDVRVSLANPCLLGPRREPPKPPSSSHPDRTSPSLLPAHFSP